MTDVLIEIAVTAIMRKEVEILSKTRVFRVTVLVAGIGAAVASFAAPYKWW